MKPQCCACKHICCNPEYDEMLDCDLALEETGEPLHEYMSYWYEVWSGDTKLGGFSKDNSKVSLTLNKTEQYQ